LHSSENSSSSSMCRWAQRKGLHVAFKKAALSPHRSRKPRNYWNKTRMAGKGPASVSTPFSYCNPRQQWGNLLIFFLPLLKNIQ